MKILVLTSVYKDISLGNEDTSTNIVNSFVHDWVKMGHEVIVIHNCHCYPRVIHEIPANIKKKLAAKMKFEIASYKAVKIKEYTDGGAKVYRLPIKKYVPHQTPGENEIKRQIKRIKTVLAQNCFVPDVITGHWASPQMEIISELKKLYGCKAACVLHGTGYINTPKFQTEKYLEAIDHLGCRSNTQSLSVQKLLKLEEKPFVCYSGVPDAYIADYQLNIEKFKHIKTWKFIYVGRLVAYKNVDATIKALHMLKNINWEFDIVGDGAERPNLEKLARELGHEEQIHFCGRISRDEVMQKLKDAHVFVMISTNEVFGLSYLEAMAASCITIASKNGGVDGVIVDGENGFLCKQGDDDELCKILDRLTLIEKEDLLNVVKQGYYTAGNFTDSKVAEMYLENIIL